MIIWKFLAPIFGAGMISAVSDILKKYAEQSKWEFDDKIIEVVDSYIDEDADRLYAATRDLHEYLEQELANRIKKDTEAKEETSEESK